MNNEITVRLNSSIEEMYRILENKDFKIVEKFFLDDTYFIPKELDLESLSIRNILSNAILLRDISEYIPIRKVHKLTFKRKTIDEDGNILKQDKVDCGILSIEEGRKFIEAIGYKELMNIKEYNVVYEKDKLQIAVKDIENGDNLIEVEMNNDNKEIDTIEKLKQMINELQIPVDKSDYFVKKAEIELKKIL